ncbi:MAG: methyltransferase domain-containing protein [Rhodospirillales bacterium]|nr:methyltransferase domain-containing protein [Rhodospirillales bacterium]
MESAWKDNVLRNFDACAKTYEDYADIQSHVAKKLAGYLPDLEHPDILEIGCGTGLFTRQLARKYKGGSFVITDISPHMVKQAQEKTKGTNMHWTVMDGDHPVCTGAYDLIAANMAFQWFEDIHTALGKLSKTLKPQGVIFYSVPGPFCFREWRIALNRLGLRAGTHDFKIPPGLFAQERITMRYSSALDFLRSIKNMGAGTEKSPRRPLSCGEMREACRVFDDIFEGRMTWHILYGCTRGRV